MRTEKKVTLYSCLYISEMLTDFYRAACN